MDRLRVVGADLDGHGPLAGRGREDVRRDPLVDPVLAAEPGQAGHGEDEGVALAGVEAAQARVHVAVEGMRAEVRALREEEGGAPRAVGPDTSALRQRRERDAALPPHERVARVLARTVRGDGEPRVHGRGDVLRAVHGEVDRPVEQA